MPSCLWTLRVVLLLQGIQAACAAEEPRALIERALKARGGLEMAKRGFAVRMKITGTFQSTIAVAGDSVQGDYLEFKHRSWQTLTATRAGKTNRLTQVYNEEKSWIAVDGQLLDMDKEELRWCCRVMYIDRVEELVDLLTDKGFTLTPLSNIEVEGRAAAGIKVSSKGQPDIHLYFDLKTGLLVKCGYRVKRPSDTKEVLLETVWSDYREPDLASADETILREAKSDVSGPALPTFLRKRTPTPADLDRIRARIPKLGDDAFEMREQASRDLIALGPIAIPLLREATRNSDREIVRRASACLQAIGEDRSKVQTAAVIRLLGLRTPVGAAKVLLNYLPIADTDLTKELYAALFAIAQAERHTDAVLLRALDDKDPLRRRAAVAVLGKDGGAYARQPGRRLFTGLPKRPKKFKLWVDDKLDIEMEESDYQFFNAVEDKVFAKP